MSHGVTHVNLLEATASPTGHSTDIQPGNDPQTMQPVRLGLKRSYTIVDYYCWLVWCEEKNIVLAGNLRSFTTKRTGRMQ